MDGAKRLLIRVLCSEEDREDFFKLVAGAFDLNTKRLAEDQDAYSMLVEYMTEYFQVDDADVLIHFTMGLITGIAVGEKYAETKTD